MKMLKPVEAAYAADNIYRVMYSNDLSVFHPSLESKFNLSAGKRFNGISGALIFRSKTGFGVVAKGKGEFQGDAIVAIRGTSNLTDWLTDFNVGLQASSSGKPVHSGFNKTFKTFESNIIRHLRGMNPNRVHCIGHSLGGALATLTADMIAEKNIANPVLYTFGCPRVGLSNFAERFTARIHAANIHRVYHSNDPVSMAPLWPFVHVPRPGTECYIDSPFSFKTAHSMENYTNSVAGRDSWNPLKVKPPRLDWDSEIETWLGSKSVLSFTFHTMKMINNAIMYIIKKILHLLGIGLQGVLTTGLTFLDQLAMLLEKGAKASREVAGHVLNLMQKILAMLGRAVQTVTDLTLGFIRYVLMTLSRSIYQMANMAVSAVYSALP